MKWPDLYMIFRSLIDVFSDIDASMSDIIQLTKHSVNEKLFRKRRS